MQRVGVILAQLAATLALFVLAAGLGKGVIPETVGLARPWMAGGLAELLFFPSAVAIWLSGSLSVRSKAAAAGVGVGIVLWVVGTIMRPVLYDVTESLELAAFVPALFTAGATPAGAVVAWVYIRNRRG